MTAPSTGVAWRQAVVGRAEQSAASLAQQVRRGGRIESLS